MKTNSQKTIDFGLAVNVNSQELVKKCFIQLKRMRRTDFLQADMDPWMTSATMKSVLGNLIMPVGLLLYFVVAPKMRQDMPRSALLSPLPGGHEKGLRSNQVPLWASHLQKLLQLLKRQKEQNVRDTKKWINPLKRVQRAGTKSHPQASRGVLSH